MEAESAEVVGGVGGWFKESVRHSLARRGIKTNNYFAYKPRSGFGKLLAGAQEGAISYAKNEDLVSRGVAPWSRQLAVQRSATLTKLSPEERELQQALVEAAFKRTAPSRGSSDASLKLQLKIAEALARGEEAKTAGARAEADRDVVAGLREQLRRADVSPQDKQNAVVVLREISDRVNAPVEVSVSSVQDDVEEVGKYVEKKVSVEAEQKRKPVQAGYTWNPVTAGGAPIKDSAGRILSSFMPGADDALAEIEGSQRLRTLKIFIDPKTHVPYGDTGVQLEGPGGKLITGAQMDAARAAVAGGSVRRSSSYVQRGDMPLQTMLQGGVR